jgi:hypothetical protein
MVAAYLFYYRQCSEMGTVRVLFLLQPPWSTVAQATPLTVLCTSVPNNSHVTFPDVNI